MYVVRTNKPLCPVSALLAYMLMRGKGPGPLFIFQDGKPLLHFVTESKGGLSAGGIVPILYSGHSFKIGAAMTAAKQGVEDSTIKMSGAGRVQHTNAT